MFKALKSFAGKVSMKKGETKELNDKEIINDLLNAGLIEEIKENKTKVEPVIKEIEEKIEEEVKKPKTSRKRK
jgi:hypothetical protein